MNLIIRKLRTLSILLSLFPSLLFFQPAAASEAVEGEGAAEGHHAESFDPGKMIMEHISDAYSWHLWGHTSIPLPVIVYSEERGLDVFSSGHFDHGHAAYRGYALRENKLVAVRELEPVHADEATVDDALTAQLWDISITKNVFGLLVSVALLLWVFISVARAYGRNEGKAPSGLQSALEPIIVFIRDDVGKAVIGEKHYKRFLPYLLTVFFFIWFNNLLGLVPIFPGGANITGNIAVPMILALITFIITTLNGNAHYWRHIFAMPGVPTWVLVILTPIEILGVFIKPFVLMIRLFANILAGHIVLLVFFFLIFIFGKESIAGGYITSVPALAFTVFINCLELLVGLLQAYVFTFLSAIYFGMAVAESHEEAH
jgi:F-type H+-transporting ATPase subunit a